VGRASRRSWTISLPPAVVADANVAEHLPALAERRGLDVGLLLAALSVMPVEWQPPEVYEPRRKEAERRMRGRDLEGLPIWSQDKDMEAAGVPVYSTGQLLDAIREAGDTSA